MADINITSFTGANNVNDSFFVKDGIVSPKVVLNADVDPSGKIVKRAGKTMFITKANSHSLWACPFCMLFAADGTLYRNVQGEAVNVGTVTGPVHPLSYAEADDKVYISNHYWQGVFDPSTNSVASWGVTLPPGPMLLAGAGNLPAGTYHVTMTNVVNGELSGNGPITTIELASEGGIQVLNRPAGALVWLTDANEPIFYLVGETSQVVAIPTVEPLPSFMCSPPPYLGNLCYAFGLMWGSNGKDVYYSEPFQLGWFKTSSNVFHFNDDVTMIAKTKTGLFIGTTVRTVFLTGTEPGKMEQSDAGAGSIPGTLAYCNNLPELGDVLGTPEKGFVDVPVWMTAEGIVAGNASGKLYNLTKHKIKTGIPSSGTSLYRNLNGVFQYLTGFKTGTAGSGAGAIDEDTYKAFLNGSIETYEKENKATSCRAAFADTASCTVRRGGVLI